MADSKLYSTREAAAYLGLKEETVKYHVYVSSALHPERVGNLLVFTEEELERFKRDRRPAHRPPKETAVHEPAMQPYLFHTLTLDRPINVASVPQRSPFRYPGGKTWLIPHIRRWLQALPACPVELIEPFAGGAIVGLTAAMEGLADHVTLVEIDEQVAAVWETILTDPDGAGWLAQRILTFDLTHDSMRATLDGIAASTRERAFQAILRNRVYRGGILAPGAAPVKNGENGRGIHSRWYPATLARRIIEIADARDRITFLQANGFDLIERTLGRADAAFFIDPPYTASKKRAGSRLYRYHEVDHVRLFRLAAQTVGDFLMTYDQAEEIEALAAAHGFRTARIPMTTTHHVTTHELLVGRDLDWLLA
jgi:DNA adenine methylase